MSDPIPLAPSLRQRFYEPLILLNALKSIFRKNRGTTPPDLESGTGKSPKETYFCFVNKLSQICDSQGKQAFGKTVSAIAVLDSGTIEYRLASNLRDKGELDETTGYLKSILNILKGVEDKQLRNRVFMEPVFSDILRRVLKFNRPRVKDYLQSLHSPCPQGISHLAFGIKFASTDGTDAGSAAASALGRLEPLLEAARNAPDDDEFARRTEAFLRSLHADYESCLDEYLKTRVRGVDEHDSPWSEIRHALGRLLSYFIAIRVIISARKIWPQLFGDFDVTSIASSVPLTFTDAPVRRSADGILRRMGGGKSVLATHQKHAVSLQVHGLDDRLRHSASPASFHPIVHAEVNLLDSVLASRARAEADGDGPLRFFNEPEFGRYIGGSKPTCVLCEKWFAGHPAGVACRATHGNVYYNWRAPDVFRESVGFAGEEEEEGRDGVRDEEDGGNPAERLRKEILEGMVKEVRAQAARALTERSLPRGTHDSRDTPTNPLLSVGRTEDELARSMGAASLGGLSVAAARRGTGSVDLASARGVSDGVASRRGGGSLGAVSTTTRSDLASRVAKALSDVSSTTGRSVDWAARMGQVNVDGPARARVSGLVGDRAPVSLDTLSTAGCVDEEEERAPKNPKVDEQRKLEGKRWDKLGAGREKPEPRVEEQQEDRTPESPSVDEQRKLEGKRGNKLGVGRKKWETKHEEEEEEDEEEERAPESPTVDQQRNLKGKGKRGNKLGVMQGKREPTDEQQEVEQEDEEDEDKEDEDEEDEDEEDEGGAKLDQ